MKKLSKIFLITIFGIINFQSFAQTFGIRAGTNISRFTLKNEYNEYLFRVNIGGTGEFKVNDALLFETGLILNYKGCKVTRDSIVQLLYLDIPASIRYSLEIGKNKLYLSAGPYVGFGISGLLVKKINGENNAEKVQWGNDGIGDNFKRLDYGINLGAEYEFGSLGIGIQYGHGLANIRPDGQPDNSQRNRLLSVYLSYKFRKKNN